MLRLKLIGIFFNINEGAIGKDSKSGREKVGDGKFVALFESFEKQNPKSYSVLNPNVQSNFIQLDDKNVGFLKSKESVFSFMEAEARLKGNRVLKETSLEGKDLADVRKVKEPILTGEKISDFDLRYKKKEKALKNKQMLKVEGEKEENSFIKEKPDGFLNADGLVNKKPTCCVQGFKKLSKGKGSVYIGGISDMTDKLQKKEEPISYKAEKEKKTPKKHSEIGGVLFPGVGFSGKSEIKGKEKKAALNTDSGTEGKIFSEKNVQLYGKSEFLRNKNSLQKQNHDTFKSVPVLVENQDNGSVEVGKTASSSDISRHDNHGMNMRAKVKIAIDTKPVQVIEKTSIDENGDKVVSALSKDKDEMVLDSKNEKISDNSGERADRFVRKEAAFVMEEKRFFQDKSPEKDLSLEKFNSTSSLIYSGKNGQEEKKKKAIVKESAFKESHKNGEFLKRKEVGSRFVLKDKRSSGDSGNVKPVVKNPSQRFVSSLNEQLTINYTFEKTQHKGEDKVFHQNSVPSSESSNLSSHSLATSDVNFSNGSYQNGYYRDGESNGGNNRTFSRGSQRYVLSGRFEDLRVKATMVRKFIKVTIEIPQHLMSVSGLRDELKEILKETDLIGLKIKIKSKSKEIYSETVFSEVSETDGKTALELRV